MNPTVSLYDGEETPDEELWFLPAPPEDQAPTDPPWPLVDRRVLVDVAAWIRAEKSLAVALAEAAAAFAALDERLRHAPEGLRHRLALREVAELSWAAGSRLPVERVALYELLRLSSTGEDVRDLQVASWALRRLQGHFGPCDWPESGVEGFLGRQPGEGEQAAPVSRPTGDDLAGLSEEWLAVLGSAEGTHPVTQAALGFFTWRSFGISGPGEILEGAVAAMKLGAEKSRGGIRFLPVASGNIGVFSRGGEVRSKLAEWYRAVEQSCLRALMELDRLEDWRARAGEITSNLSGKTPPRLIAALAETPVMSAEMAASACGVSKMSALRNLSEFERRRLVRETTGQGRYRFWTVKV